MTLAGFAPRAALVAALLVSGLPGAARAQAAPAAMPTGTLPGGVSYELRPDATQSATAIALWYRAPAGGFGEPAIPGFSALAADTVAASAGLTGTSLGELVDGFGGVLSVAVYPDSVSVTAVVPPERASAVVRAMTGAYFAPVVTDDGFQVGLRETGQDALVRSFDPSDAIENALGASLFATGPLHDGTIPAAGAFKGIDAAQVRTFAERAFRPSNAILVLTGAVDAGVLSGVANRPEVSTAGSEPPAPQTAQPSPRPSAAPIVANATGVGLGWVGPPIADEESATALDFLADALFAPHTGLVTRAVADRKVSVSGKFVTYHSAGVFLVTLSGDDVPAAVPIVEQTIARAVKPLAPAAFAAAKAGFVYRLLGDMETPGEIADTYGWYAVEGDAAYAPAEGGTAGRYFALADALTPQSVARVAARYLGGAPATVTLIKAQTKASPT
ncbi:MAG TPA: insulinase family protein [Candidatus Sulfotelmatobacter sp.]|nr:insulinase family protein [Candidatus Sulfotelmatobacter sp.]